MSKIYIALEGSGHSVIDAMDELISGGGVTAYSMEELLEDVSGDENDVFIFECIDKGIVKTVRKFISSDKKKKGKQ